MRECVLCGTYFHASPTELTRERTICSFCWDSDDEDVIQEKALQSFLKREKNLKDKYNLSMEEVNDILKSQNYRCAICHNYLEPSSDRRWRPHVDHCHSSGKVRGILCVNCNLGIGLMKDNTKILLSAIGYLGSHQE